MKEKVFKDEIGVFEEYPEWIFYCGGMLKLLFCSPRPRYLLMLLYSISVGSRRYIRAV
jgi:hypothetical protein